MPSMPPRWRSRANIRTITRDHAKTFITELRQRDRSSATTSSACKAMIVQKLDKGFQVTATGSVTDDLPAARKVHEERQRDQLDGRERHGAGGQLVRPARAGARHGQHRVDELRRDRLEFLLDDWNAPGFRQPHRGGEGGGKDAGRYRDARQSDRQRPGEDCGRAVRRSGQRRLATYVTNPPGWIDWNDTAQANWNGANFNRQYQHRRDVHARQRTASRSATSGSSISSQPQFDGQVGGLRGNARRALRPLRHDADAPPLPIASSCRTSAPTSRIAITRRHGGSVPVRQAPRVERRRHAIRQQFSDEQRDKHERIVQLHISEQLPIDKTARLHRRRPDCAEGLGQIQVHKRPSNKAIRLSRPAERTVEALTRSPVRVRAKRGCPRPIYPLANARTRHAIKTQIDNMIGYYSSGTFLPTGLVWGWHVLSPDDPYTEGVAPGNQYYSRTIKAIVFFTDGENEVADQSRRQSFQTTTALQQLVLSGSGTTTHRLSTTAARARLSPRSTPRPPRSARTSRRTGRRETSDDIRLYVVTFGTISSSTTTLMTNCASVEDDGTALLSRADHVRPAGHLPRHRRGPERHPSVDVTGSTETPMRRFPARRIVALFRFTRPGADCRRQPGQHVLIPIEPQWFILCKPKHLVSRVGVNEIFSQAFLTIS